MYSQWYATDTSPKTFYVSCSATNGKAINSPKSAASSKTVNLYKPKLPTPKIGYACGNIIDRLLIPATETSLAIQTYFQNNILIPVDFDFWVDVVDGPAMPEGSKWKLDLGNGSYRGAVGGADTSADTDMGTYLTSVNIGALTDDLSLPMTTREISVVVEHPCYESSASVPMKFKLYSSVPASITDFNAEIDCDGGGAMEQTHAVTASNGFTGHIETSTFLDLPDADSGAQFDWYVKVGSGAYTLIKTTYSPDDISFSMEDAGINVESLVPEDEIDDDDDYLTVEIKCHISFPGTDLEKDSETNPGVNLLVWLRICRAVW